MANKKNANDSDGVGNTVNDFITFVYDSRRKTVLGRNSDSWGNGVFMIVIIISG